MQNIIVFSDHSANLQALREALGGQNYQILSPEGELAARLEEKTNVVILDCREDSVKYLTELRWQNVGIPVIIIYTELPLAELIKAVKLGRALIVEAKEIYRKLPVLLQATAETVFDAEGLLTPYLLGNSEVIRKCRAELEILIRLNLDIFIFGGPGSGKGQIVRFLHHKGWSPDRGIMELNLDNFAGENYETHIWTAVQEAYKKHDTNLAGLRQPLYSTIYLKGLENKDILFIISLLEWLHEQKIDKENLFNGTRVIVALEGQELLQNIPKEFFDKYALLRIPALAEHREDLPNIVSALLAELNNKYHRQVTYLSAEVWDYIFTAEWPGNIEELRYNLETVFLDMPADQITIDFQDLFINEQRLFAFAARNRITKSTNAGQDLLKRYTGE